MEAGIAYQKELAGFDASEDLLNIASNKQFIVSYDTNHNLDVYNINSQKQQKVTADLPDFVLTGIKFQFKGSLFVTSFENGTIILLDGNNPGKIIDTYDYFDSIDPKEKEKLSKSNQKCFFRNLTFVDNFTFIGVLQKGSDNLNCKEQLFKFSIVKNDNNSTFSIKNYCDVIHFEAKKENRSIGNPLKIFDNTIHITRISSLLIFSEEDENVEKMPQMIGISLRKKNKFLIATVNDFRFEIVQSFTADNSISSFAYQPDLNMIKLVFLSYSYHMIFVKEIKLNNDFSKKVTISDICIIKLPVIICSNLKCISFISPELITIVFSSPGSLNISIYSIKKGKIVGVLPPVSNSNLFLNSKFSVASSVTDESVYLISKGKALSFSNKIVSQLAEEGKFVPPNIEEFLSNSTARSDSLHDLYRSLPVQHISQKSANAGMKSKRSSALVSIWNTLSDKKSKEKIQLEKPKYIDDFKDDDQIPKKVVNDNDFTVSNREDFDKFKQNNQIKEGIEYCVRLYDEQLANENDLNEIKCIKLHAIDFLKIYVDNELKNQHLNMQKFYDEIIDYSKKLSIVKDWLLTKSVLSSFPPSFAGDVYESVLNDHSNALKCYEIDNQKGKNVEKMVKIINDHSTTPSVINWIFSCVKYMKDISFPRLSSFIVSKNAYIKESQSIEILKKMLGTVAFYSNRNNLSLNVIINSLIITFSNEKIGSENNIYKFVESFIIDSIEKNNSSINSFSKKSLDFLLQQIFSKETNNKDSHENLLISLLKVKNKDGSPVNIFPEESSFSYKLYLKCCSFGFKKAEELIKEINLEKPDFNIRIFIYYSISFIQNKSTSSSNFESELNEKKKIIFDYISSEYQETENEQIKQDIEEVVSENITNLVSILSYMSPQKTTTEPNYLQKLFSDVFPEEFTRLIINDVIKNDDIRLAVIHAIINDGINKSYELLEIVATQIIQLIPFIITNEAYKDDIKKFIIIGSNHFHDNEKIHNCLASESLLSVCENHALFDCCCLLCIINDLNEKAVYYLRQLILALNSKDFKTSSNLHQQICSAFYLDDDDDDDDDYLNLNNELESDETFNFISSQYLKLIMKIKSNIDIVEITALKLFQDNIKNVWKFFVLLVDAFVNAIKYKTDSIGTYLLDDIIGLYHDICFIMSSNEKNNIDFCAIIRVTKQSFSCLCESLQNKVLSKLIADQVFAPQTLKSIENIILEKPLQQKSILKQAYCARCGMPMFIDDIGIYTYKCGHAVHNLSFCKRSNSNCPICS